MVNKIFSARSFCFVSLIVVLLFIFSNRASAVSANDSLNNVYQCGTLDSAGTYTMNQSITQSTNAICITLTAQNIILDCNGFSISGAAVANKAGVYSTKINTTIKNCNISMKPTSGGVGISLLNANNSYIYNNTLNSQYYGLYLSKTSYILIENNTANSNGDYGIYLSSSLGNNITGNTANSNSDHGIYLSSSPNNTLTHNVANSNTYHGIYLSSSQNNTLTSNSVSSNVQYGIYLSSSANSNLQNNNLSGNAYNFQIGGNNLGDYNNTIGTTNIIDYSYTIYYNFSISNYLFDSTTAPNAGTAVCAGCLNVTYKNLNLSHSNYAGLTLYLTNDSTVKNVTSNSNEMYGILLSSSSNNIVDSSTTNSNANFGIYLISSSGNNLTSNVANSNDYGILLATSLNNNVTSNIANFNSFDGILLSSSSGNNLQNNNMSGNTINFQTSSASLSDFNNTIGTTNIVDYSYRMYYNISISNYLFDSTTAPNAGIVVCADCFNVTYKDLTLGRNNSAGFFFYLTNNSVVQNVTARSNANSGIYLLSSSNNTLISNTVVSNRYYGIYLSSSSNNNLTSNTANSNENHGIYLLSSSSNNHLASNRLDSNFMTGIYVSTSSGNNLTSNDASFSSHGGIIIFNSSNIFLNSNLLGSNSGPAIVFGNGTNISLSSNNLENNLNTNVIRSDFITEKVERTYNLDSQISFNISVKYANGSDCYSFNYTVLSYPTAELTASNVSNNVTVSFNSSKAGLHTVFLNITTFPDNTTETRLFAFLVGNLSSGTMRYYFHSNAPTHGQPPDLAGYDSGSLLSTPVTEEEFRTCTIWVQYQPDEILKPMYLIKNISASMWHKASNAPYSIGVQLYSNYSNSMDYDVDANGLTGVYVFNQTNFTNLNVTSDYPWRFYWLAIKMDATGPYVKSNATDQSYVDFTYLSTGPEILQFTENAGSDIRNMKLLSSTFDNSANKNSTIQLDGEGNVTIVLNLTSTNYAVKYDGILCPSQNCTVNSNSGGIINVTLSLGSIHTLTLAEETTPPSITINSPANQTYTTSLIIFNLTVADYTEVDRCFYSLEGIVSNATMSNVSSEWSGSTSFGDGSYTVNFYCNDSLGNVNNTERMTFSISLPSTTVVQSSGGGLPSYKPAEVNLENGYEKDLREGFKINFRAGDGKSENHTLTVKDISNGSVTITVSSEPVTFTLKVNETKKLDLDKNGIYDLEIYLKEIKGYFANVGLKTIKEKIIGEENVSEETGEIIDEDETVVAEEDKKEINLFLVFGSAVVIIILVICLILVLRHRNRKRRLRGY